MVHRWSSYFEIVTSKYVAFVNFKQFNGKYGCSSCLCSGESLFLEAGSSTHVYSYDENPEMRTIEKTIENAAKALNKGKPIKGLKGPTNFSKITTNFVVGTAIDRMHATKGGVVKKIIFLWFHLKYSHCKFSLYNVIGVMNNLLRTIKSPKFVHGITRNVDELVHEKASEELPPGPVADFCQSRA